MNHQNAPENTEDAVLTVQEHEIADISQQAELVPKTIFVVDDELFQLKKSHVLSVAAGFYDAIEDVNDPVFDNLWEVAKAVPVLGADRWSIDEAANYLSSEEAVSSVLLSSKFEQIANERLKKLLASFTAQAARVAELKKVFLHAFQAPEFDLKFMPGPRPHFAELRHCAAVFLDLFLVREDPTPVLTVQRYLKDLAREAGDAALPPLVLISSHPELNDDKHGFSEHAGISAAGLMILPKEKLMEPAFQVTGLALAFKQLDRQKNVAHALRKFIGSWLDALENAKERTARTLWNLDASAMQQIHLASVSDHDPYDEHLNELLSREHLFHVEAQAKVAGSIAELDKQFRAQLNKDGQIENRLISPMADVKTARDFISHFTWFGSAPPQSFMDDLEGAATRISRSLPYGSVLVPEQFGDGSKCLVHITQQCDLNGISRSRNTLGTLIFSKANASELRASSNPIVKDELVAKSLRIRSGEGEREFDLRIEVGDLVAMSLREFLEKAREDGWRVVGRLRSDITNHIVAATTNQMSRPASQKMIRPGLHKSKVFLQSKKLPRKSLVLTEKNSTQGKICSILRDGKTYSFEDNASIELALWLAHNAATIDLKLDPDALSIELRRGWRSQSTLQGELRIRVRECDSLDSAYAAISDGDIGNGSVQLTVVHEK